MKDNIIHDSISGRLMMLLADFSKVDLFSMADATVLKDELGIDSVDALDLMFLLEKEFRIELVQDEMHKVKSVGDLKKIIMESVKRTISHK